MLPADLAHSLVSSPIVVDFPDPFLPIKPKISPLCKAKLSPLMGTKAEEYFLYSITIIIYVN